MAGFAALALLVTLLLPWYEKRSSTSGPAPAAGEREPVGAPGLHVRRGGRAAGRRSPCSFCLGAVAAASGFHLPGGDGLVIMLAGGWAELLLIWRLFDKPDVADPGATVGIQWGMFAAMVAAGVLIAAGARVRAAHRPEPPNPAEDLDWERPRRRAPRDRPSRAPRDPDRRHPGARRPAAWEGEAPRAARPPRAPAAGTPRSHAPSRTDRLPDRSATPPHAPRSDGMRAFGRPSCPMCAPCAPCCGSASPSPRPAAPLPPRLGRPAVDAAAERLGVAPVRRPALGAVAGGDGRALAFWSEQATRTPVLRWQVRLARPGSAHVRPRSRPRRRPLRRRRLRQRRTLAGFERPIGPPEVGAHGCRSASAAPTARSAAPPRSPTATGCCDPRSPPTMTATPRSPGSPTAGRRNDRVYVSLRRAGGSFGRRSSSPRGGSAPSPSPWAHRGRCWWRGTPAARSARASPNR